MKTQSDLKQPSPRQRQAWSLQVVGDRRTSLMTNDVKRSLSARLRFPTDNRDSRASSCWPGRLRPVFGEKRGSRIGKNSLARRVHRSGRGSNQPRLPNRVRRGGPCGFSKRHGGSLVKSCVLTDREQKCFIFVPIVRRAVLRKRDSMGRDAFSSPPRRHMNDQ